MIDEARFFVPTRNIHNIRCGSSTIDVVRGNTHGALDLGNQSCCLFKQTNNRWYRQFPGGSGCYDRGWQSYGAGRESTQKKYETQPTKIDRRSLSSPKPWYRYRKKKKMTRVASRTPLSADSYLRSGFSNYGATYWHVPSRCSTKFRVPSWPWDMWLFS